MIRNIDFTVKISKHYSPNNFQVFYYIFILLLKLFLRTTTIYNIYYIICLANYN